MTSRTGRVRATVTAREKRNRSAFAERFPAVLAHVDKHCSGRSRLVRERRQAVNIDLDGALLYPVPAADYARDQLQAFRDDPDRLCFTDPSYCNLSPVSLALFDDLREHLRADQALAHLAAHPVVDVGYLFVFGIGLGDHLAALLAETPARHVVLIEPFAEFFAHSLAATDWCALLEVADRRKITLHFITADTPDLVCLHVQHVISVSGNVFIDGSYFFQHYPCWIFRETMLLLKDRLRAYYHTSGFFEDELEMLRNCHGNLSHTSVRVLEWKRRREQTLPVLLVGAGPSLDADLPRLRVLRERAILVSCGTALGILLKNGIRPDVHCEIERGAVVHTLLSRERERHGLSGITLLAASTVDPRVPALFDRTWCFVRGGLSPATVLTAGIASLPFSDPLCCNGAFAALSALGFRNFWLFGLDLAQKQEGRHHAKDSLYFESENKGLDTVYRNSFDRIAPGNFGGEVRTYWAFDCGRSALASAIRVVGAKVVNCSDGARIDGAVPKVAAAVTLPEARVDRQAVLARLEQEMLCFAPGERLAARDLQRHAAGCEAYLGLLDGVIEAWLAGEDSFFDLEERLVRQVTERIDDVAGFHAICRGSVMAMLRLGAFFASRITDPQIRLRLRPAFATAWRRQCAVMAKEAAELLQTLSHAAPDAAPRAERAA